MDKRYCDSFVDEMNMNGFYSFNDFDDDLTDKQHLRIIEDIFQIIWILFIAERELKFMHNNLLDRRIIVEHIDKPIYYHLKFKDRPELETIWCCEYVKVKLYDFRKF